MSATTPPPVEGTQGPAPIEMLWDRHRAKLNGMMWLLVLALGFYYGLKYYNQKQVDARWSAFAASSLLDAGYDLNGGDPEALDPIDIAQLRALEKAPLEKLEQARQAAENSQKPYLIWLIANRALEEKDWSKAEATCKALETEFPNHALVLKTAYPVQARAAEPSKDTTAKKPKAPEEEQLRPMVAGSMVEALRAQIAKEQTFKLPSAFAQPIIPADAAKYKVKLSGGREFTIALMTLQAPKPSEAFQKLVEANFWNGLSVDELWRPTKQTRNFAITQFHFGFASTKDENTSNWDTTKPIDKEQLVDEVTNLSHFPGAVAARGGAEGKSEVERLWISVDDLSHVFDGQRQVFAYVTEGVDTLKALCDVSLSKADEEKAGHGRPADSIRIESVTKL